MKKNILVFGSISGLFISLVMTYSTTSCYTNADFESGQWLGYTSMIMGLAFIFVGIKNYRDKFNNGIITFGKAFQIGLYISLIASTFYVLAWIINYYLFMPDFMDVYADHMLKKAAADGASAAELKNTADEIAWYKDMYRNPLFVVLLTYTEILPVGLIISLIAAFILKRKQRSAVEEA